MRNYFQVSSSFYCFRLYIYSEMGLSTNKYIVPKKYLNAAQRYGWLNEITYDNEK